MASTDAAPPQGNPAPSPPKVDADALPAGQFAGTLVSPPNDERMFTLTITYPQVRQKPGARMPNLQTAQGQNILRQYQQLLNLQQQRGQSNAPQQALLNTMQMQQLGTQLQMSQQRAMQPMTRVQQQQAQRELRLVQQDIKAIQNLFQVVPMKRDVDFQAADNVKVRLKNPPEQFDDKGNIKKYTSAELAALKGKDKSLIGYESSVEGLKPGQTVLVTLRAAKKLKSTTAPTPATKKDKEAEKKETDSATDHKMQATMIVIVQDSDAATDSTAPAKKKKK
jgi:hypothetical protein